MTADKRTNLYRWERCPCCDGTGKRKTYEGHHLRALRLRNSLSLREMARRLNLSAAYISDVERERRAVTERVLFEYEKLP